MAGKKLTQTQQCVFDHIATHRFDYIAKISELLFSFDVSNNSVFDDKTAIDDR